MAKRDFKVNLLIDINNIFPAKKTQFFQKNIKVIDKTSIFLIPNIIKSLFILRNIKKAISYGFITFDNPDIVHFSYSSLGISYLPVIKFSSKIKFAVSCRGTGENIKPYINSNRRIAIMDLFHNIDLVHCVSKIMLDKLSNDFELNMQKAFVNRPAIDINKFKNSGNDQNKLNKNIVVITGRLNYVKGIIFAILATKDIIKKVDNFELRIIGWGPDEEFLRFSIINLRLENHIKLVGYLDSDSIIHELKSAKIFLLPSVSEGISNAVLEAMSIGIPVISTNVGGMSEVIKNGINGILIDPYSPSQISESIIKLIENIELCNSIVRSARVTVENDYNLERLGNVFEFEYKKLITQN